jgi:hypothetical protein
MAPHLYPHIALLFIEHSYNRHLASKRWTLSFHATTRTASPRPCFPIWLEGWCDNSCGQGGSAFMSPDITRHGDDLASIAHCNRVDTYVVASCKTLALFLS